MSTVEGEIHRRLDAIERKIDNGRFVAKEIFELWAKSVIDKIDNQRDDLAGRLKELEESNKWFMRLGVTLFMGVVLEGAMLGFALLGGPR